MEILCSKCKYLERPYYNCDECEGFGWITVCFKCAEPDNLVQLSDNEYGCLKCNTKTIRNEKKLR